MQEKAFSAHTATVRNGGNVSGLTLRFVLHMLIFRLSGLRVTVEGGWGLFQKKLLVISYAFAPFSRVGAKRWTALSRHLPARGCSCTVITVKPRYYPTLDNELQACASEIRRTSVFLPPVEVYTGGFLSRLRRFFTERAQSLLFPIDRFQGWEPFAVFAANRALTHKEHHAVIASGPPFSSFRAALRVSRRAGIPLILDYRDPWTGYRWERAIPKTLRNLEWRLVSQASAAVFCTKRMRESFLSTFPEFPAEMTEVVTNGYEEPVAEGSRPALPGIHIAHAGSLYGRRNLAMMAEPISMYMAKHGKPVSLHHWGSVRPEDSAAYEKEGLYGVLQIHPPVSHGEMLARLKGSDALFCPSGGDVAYALPYKVFDYMATGIPILAATPKDSELAEFVAALGVGYRGGIDEPESLFNALEACVKAKSYAPPEEYLWRSVAERLSGFLSRVAV